MLAVLYSSFVSCFRLDYYLRDSFLIFGLCNCFLYKNLYYFCSTQQEKNRIYVQNNLGHGGFGIVYKASLKKEDGEETVCLKMVILLIQILIILYVYLQCIYIMYSSDFNVNQW